MNRHYLLAVIVLHSVRLGYQQTVPCPAEHIRWNDVCVPIVLPPTCPSGYYYVNSQCVQQNCSANQIMINGICYPNYPVYPTSGPSLLSCSSGYVLYNTLCFHTTFVVSTVCKHCDYYSCPLICVDHSPETTTSTTTSTSTSTTTTTLAPPGCPPDSVLIDGECRLIYCSKGIPHQGRCIEPICIDGLVWSGNSCVEPHVITTILEIDNKIITKANQTGPVVHKPEVTNTVIYHTSTEKFDEATPPPTTPATNRTSKCCTIVSPRLCKRYKAKWLCFNRHYNRCDDFCGNNKIIYLRVPQIIDHPPVLVMPPNPPLDDCTENCSPLDVSDIDCSGCISNHRATCSSYCYNYPCGRGRCTFVDQREYCTTYPRPSGCSSHDGCYGDWCNCQEPDSIC